MSDLYIGEIRMFAGNFAPQGWAFCSGQTLAIAENDALFTLIGTTYGGDGEETFNLPNLASRVPIYMGTLLMGSDYIIGQQGGAEMVTLTANQMPIHNHLPQAGESSTSNTPGNHLWARWPGAHYTNQIDGLQSMDPDALGPAGGSQPHDNMLPYLAVNFIISLFGIFPSQS